MTTQPRPPARSAPQKDGARKTMTSSTEAKTNKKRSSESSASSQSAPPAPAGTAEMTPAKAPAKKAAPKPVAAPVGARIPSPPGTPQLGPFADDFQHDLTEPQYYQNRELTWLSFNYRVLHEGEDARTPLLERVKFLAIVCSNLDEFFMKRIGGLKQQVGARVHRRTVDGRTPHEQIENCYEYISELERRTQALFRTLQKALGRHDIRIKRHEELTKKQQAWLREYYQENIFPLVTPQAMDPAHPFPFVSNLSLNLLVTLHHPGESEELLARIKVPTGGGIPRFLAVEGERVFVPLEEVIGANLDLLFPGMEIEGWEFFRVTRNANTELDEEKADDLLAMIETELRERKFAPIVRLEVAKGMHPVHRGMLAAELQLDEDADVFEVDGVLALRDLFGIAGLDMPELHDPPHSPIDHPELPAEESLFHVIRRHGPVLLQHPYESFSTSVVRFLREASRDPKVRAIKMTLYRTSDDSRVIQSLIDAALNGKQVAVVVELKARFDEAANIRWAARLEEAGIHVTYGVVGLKTHCKVVLVVRQDYDGLRRYAHFGTGNYHAGTARIYSDLGILTCDEQLGRDLTELFNYLTTGYKPKRSYSKLLPSPKILKQSLLSKIEREIEHKKAGRDALIQLKMNALEDVDITRALYRATGAGVRVDLFVRDTCRLLPGVPGLSESATVISTVGRFLEHTRLYYFKNDGEDEYYIGSADCMKRNLESRVESVVPVEDPRHKEALRVFLDTQLDDPRGAWVLQPDGSFVQRMPAPGKRGRHSQDTMIEAAARRRKEAARLKKRRPKGLKRKQSGS